MVQKKFRYGKRNFKGLIFLTWKQMMYLYNHLLGKQINSKNPVVNLK